MRLETEPHGEPDEIAVVDQYRHPSPPQDFVSPLYEKSQRMAILRQAVTHFLNGDYDKIDGEPVVDPDLTDNRLVMDRVQQDTNGDKVVIMDDIGMDIDQVLQETP